jgi:glucokinase
MTERLYAGIDIGATNVKFGLVAGDGEIKFRGQTATPNDGIPEKLFEAVARCGEALLLEADDAGGRVEYIGVGSPGSIDVVSGVIQGTCPNIPGWVGFPLRDRLAERLNLPVQVDNDANCAALAEFRFGAGQGFRHIICLTIGTGIGGGLIINGRLHRGADWSAGEVGHMIVTGEPAGPQGVYLESLVSSRALVARVREKLGDDSSPAFKSLVGDDPGRLTVRKIFTAVKRNDRLATDIITAMARTFGTYLASLVNVFNPELIVLGGGVVEGGNLFVDMVRETVLSAALPSAKAHLGVVPAQLGNAAGFIGAAFLGEADGVSDVK